MNLVLTELFPFLCETNKTNYYQHTKFLESGVRKHNLFIN